MSENNNDIKERAKAWALRAKAAESKARKEYLFRCEELKKFIKDNNLKDKKIYDAEGVEIDFYTWIANILYGYFSYEDNAGRIEKEEGRFFDRNAEIDTKEFREKYKFILPAKILFTAWRDATVEGYEEDWEMYERSGSKGWPVFLEHHHDDWVQDNWDKSIYELSKNIKTEDLQEVDWITDIRRGV